jgi:ABC-type nickel/cobalt efflux system permease component RcnA
MRLFRLLRLLPLIVAAISALLPAPAAAHPLGNFTVNRYSRVAVGAEQITLFYVLDMAEIPTFQELARIDADGDGVLSDTEQADYAASASAALRDGLLLRIADEPLALHLGSYALEFPVGQGDLKTLRLTMNLSAPLPAGRDWDAHYTDTNYGDRLGWKEVIVTAATGARILEASVPNSDISQELRVYPADLLQSPLDVSSASFRFEAAPGASGTGVVAPNAALNAARSEDAFAALITDPAREPLALLGALLIAFGLGAAHALSPGHGKTIVGAYLVGSRGTAWHALLLGLTTTVTHTAGVFALGLVTLFVSRYILPEQLYPWLSVLAGFMVLLIGAGLLRLRWQQWRAPAHHGFALDGNGGHSHGFGYHTHLPNERGQLRGLVALGVSGGLIPCPSALIVLLAAIAVGQVGYGLLLVSVFSLGLAAVLTTIGIALVYAGRLLAKLPAPGPVVRLVPLLGAALVTIVGFGITIQALAQVGIF